MVWPLRRLERRCQKLFGEQLRRTGEELIAAASTTEDCTTTQEGGDKRAIVVSAPFRRYTPNILSDNSGAGKVPSQKSKQESAHQRVIDEMAQTIAQRTAQAAVPQRKRLLDLADEYRHLGPEAITVIIDALGELDQEPERMADIARINMERRLSVDQPEEESQVIDVVLVDEPTKENENHER